MQVLKESERVLASWSCGARGPEPLTWVLGTQPTSLLSHLASLYSFKLFGKIGLTYLNGKSKFYIGTEFFLTALAFTAKGRRQKSPHGRVINVGEPSPQVCRSCSVWNGMISAILQGWQDGSKGIGSCHQT